VFYWWSGILIPSKGHRNLICAAPSLLVIPFLNTTPKIHWPILKLILLFYYKLLVLLMIKFVSQNLSYRYHLCKGHWKILQCLSIARHYTENTVLVLTKEMLQSIFIPIIQSAGSPVTYFMLTENMGKTQYYMDPSSWEESISFLYSRVTSQLAGVEVRIKLLSFHYMSVFLRTENSGKHSSRLASVTGDL
jgi:hypothetical protein